MTNGRLPDLRPDSRDHHEVVMKRLSDAHGNSTIVIHLLTIVAVWPDWAQTGTREVQAV